MKLSHLLVDAMRIQREIEIAARGRSRLPLQPSPANRPAASRQAGLVRRLLSAV
jgi:hypothetical protein